MRRRVAVTGRLANDAACEVRDATTLGVVGTCAEVVTAYGLSFAAYDLLGTDHKTHSEELEALSAMGFHPIDHETLAKEDMRAGYQRMAQRRPSLDYEIDGIVIKIDFISYDKGLAFGDTRVLNFFYFILIIFFSN